MCSWLSAHKNGEGANKQTQTHTKTTTTIEDTD